MRCARGEQWRILPKPTLVSSRSRQGRKKLHSLYEKNKNIANAFPNDKPRLSSAHCRYVIGTSEAIHEAREMCTTLKMSSRCITRSFPYARMQWRVYGRRTWRFNYKRPRLLHGHVSDSTRVSSRKLRLYINQGDCIPSVQFTVSGTIHAKLFRFYLCDFCHFFISYANKRKGKDSITLDMDIWTILTFHFQLFAFNLKNIFSFPAFHVIIKV